MTGKNFTVPRDIADVVYFGVRLHPDFTDERDQPLLDDLYRRKTPHMTLGTFVGLLGRWHPVKCEIQMPVPREKPWQQPPVVLVYPEDWQTRHGRAPLPPPEKPEQPEGTDRPGWERRSATSFMFMPNRYLVSLDSESGYWTASWLEMTTSHEKLWQAQEWVEKAEAERLFMGEPEPEPGADRPLVIYHANCMDGFGAAWVCWRQFGSHADYVATRYPSDGKPTELPSVDGRVVFMVDFCVSREQLLEVKAKAKSLQVIDHHKSHREACEGLNFCLFDMDQSGAGLTWRFFRGMGSPPWLVSYVEDRDLWRFKLPDSEAINAYIGALPKDFHVWNDAQRGGREAAKTRGTAILLYMENYLRSVGKHHRRQEFAGFPNIPVVNTPHMISELVGHLAADAEFAVGWFQDERGQYVYSLRSRNGFDVSAVAARFGGGGHAAAAGFTVSSMVHGT